MDPNAWQHYRWAAAAQAAQAVPNRLAFPQALQSGIDYQNTVGQHINAITYQSSSSAFIIPL